MKPAPPTEHAEQCDFLRWADALTATKPELHLLFAIPNGGARSRATAGKLKAEGVKPGVPDLCLPIARQGAHGLFLEMKRIRGGTVSPQQKWWREQLTAQGYLVRTPRGAAEAKQAVLDYLGTESPTAPICPPPSVDRRPKLPSKAKVTDYRRPGKTPKLGWTAA